jgi:ribosome-binding factor A
VSRRTLRVADLLRRELSELLIHRVRDPRVRLATVSHVEVSPDLRRAEVWVSVLGDEEQRNEAVAGLVHARGFLRSELAHRLKSLKVTPELVFELDRGAEHSQRISDLLEDLHDDDSP